MRRRLRELDLFNFGKRLLKGDLNPCKCLKGGCQEAGPGSPWWCRAVRLEAAAETDVQNVPPEHEEEYLCCAGEHELKLISRRGCGVFLTGDIQKLPGHNAVLWAMG